MRGLGAVAALLVLAGCLGGGGLSDPTPTLGAEVAISYAYACPPGETFERAPGVCATSLVDAENNIDEPYLVIAPFDPDLLVLVAHNVRTRLVSPDLALQPLVNGAYVSEDGGATWRRAELPAVEIPSTFGPLQARLYYDPAIDITPKGLIHFAGIASNDLGAVLGQRAGSHNVPYWTMSSDLGATWTDPVVLDERFSDRTFLTVEPTGRIVVLWGVYTGDETVLRTALAWSDDNGVTWSAPLDTECRGFSPPRIIEGVASFVCVKGEGSYPPDATLVRLAGSEVVEIASIGELPGYRARSGVFPGGLSVVNDAGSMRLTASHDDGRTWSDPIDVLDAMRVDDGHPRAFMKWSDADPWGGIHVVIGVSDNEGCAGGSRGAPGTCRIIHGVFSSSNMTLVHEAILSEADGASAYRTPGSIPPPTEFAIGDDFYAFDFANDHGILLWTRDGGVDLTHVVRAS